MSKRRPLALLATSLLAVACSAPSVPATLPASPPASSSTNPQVTPSPEPSLDVALVESHEAACQANDAEYVAMGGQSWLAGLERVLVLQTFDHPVHLYAEQGPRYAICYASLPDEVRIGSDVWPDFPAQGWVTPLIRLTAPQIGWTMHMGFADPLVDRVGVEIEGIGPVWGTVGDGWFLIQWPFEGSDAPDPLGGYQGYDSCGQPLRDVTLEGEPTPCPPGG